MVATSFRPACGTGIPPAGQPCLNSGGWAGQQVNAFCRQASGTVQCVDATGFGSTQNVLSGVQFIRGYGSTPTGTGPPQLRSAYLDAASPAGCGAYFSSIPTTCTARLSVTVDLGALQGTYPNVPPPGTHPEPLKASDVEVRYQAGRTDGSSFCDYGTNCDLLPSSPNATGVVTFSTRRTASSPDVPLPAGSQNTAVAIQIGVRNTTNLTGGNCAGFNANCRWWWNGNGRVNQNQIDDASEIVATPVQRAFSGDTDLTGALRWTRLTADTNCDGTLDLGLSETVEAASVPTGQNCFYMEIGLQGALAKDQDEPPIALNLGSTGSQRAFIDCDDAAGSTSRARSRTAAPHATGRIPSSTMARVRFPTPIVPATVAPKPCSAHIRPLGTLPMAGRRLAASSRRAVPATVSCVASTIGCLEFSTTRPALPTTNTSFRDATTGTMPITATRTRLAPTSSHSHRTVRPRHEGIGFASTTLVSCPSSSRRTTRSRVPVATIPDCGDRRVLRDRLRTDDWRRRRVAGGCA